ncbi:MAG TPA: hypothetical protein VGO92_10375 [Acidimicrobiales bacterium]|jgi:hypothetical protein|nr:hypothetical protein [Acidimicrobiales bacterium]
MQVQLGPLPSDSAQAWLDYAKGVVGAALKQLPIQVAAQFSAYLEEWSEAAAEGEVFLWEGKAEPEEVEYLLHAWFNLAQALVAERGPDAGPPGPPEGRVFYNGLVNGLLGALRKENRATAEFADHLAPFWPGLETAP